MIISKKEAKPLGDTTVNLFVKVERRLDLYSTTKTDRKGRFLFVPENGRYRLVVVSAEGQILGRKEMTITDKQPKVNQEIMVD